MIKVLFKGLGPKDTVTYKDSIIHNGAAVEMEEAHAKPYIELGIAYEVQDEQEIAAVQKLEQKNEKKRKEIQKKVGEQ